jgi:pimeloyl-ACP methyl ester carboxylesterase
MATSNCMGTAETFFLPSGRILSYAHFGHVPSATNTPARLTLFYFHGFPASRLEAALSHATALKHGVHIVAPDRPGMGRSAFQPGRAIADWPADVLALADHLAVARFAVLGVSGGVPYALACAHAIPRERLVAVACASGMYPVKLGTEGMMWKSRVALGVAAWVPGLMGAVLDFGIGRPARNEADPSKFDEVVMEDMKTRPEVDVKCFENEEFKEGFLKSVREGVIVSGQGMAWELKLNALPWGFELYEIDAGRAEGAKPFVTIWHGGKDVNCPLGMADKAAALIKGAEYVRLEEEGHVSLLVNHMDGIFAKLVEGAP